VTRQPCDDGVIRSARAESPCAKKAEKFVLIAAILGSSITFIDGTVINVVLPVLQRELGADVSQIQWIVEMYALMLSALILVGGSLGDRLGRRKVFMAGVVIFAAASVWCGFSPDIFQLILARGIQGIGAAMLVPGSLALISANFSQEKRGRAIGSWSGFTSIAAGIGPVLGGWLAESISWRWIFFINIPLSIAVLVVSWLFVPESRDESTRGRVDWLGAGLATIGLGGEDYGLIESDSQGFRTPQVLISLTVGVTAFALFILAELRENNPMMPLALFRSNTFSGANILTLFLYAALSGLLFFLPFMLIQVHGYAASSAGAALLPFVITMFILSRWAGGLVTRYGSKLPLTVGPLVTAGGFALFGILSGNSGGYWTAFFPGIMVMSLGMSISVAPLTTTVMGAVDQGHAGIASGINNAVSRVAALLAVAAFGVLMLLSFQRGLEQRLSSMDLSREQSTGIISQGNDLLNLKIPDGIDAATSDSIRLAVRDSFVKGFRLITFTSAGLAVLSAVSARLLISGKVKKGAESQ
jgi:EmrB/QacA subfamily drug resistance transporter